MKKVLVQPWIWRDSWSGPENDGYSLHLSERGRESYVTNTYGDRSASTPEEYASAELASFWIEVTAKVYTKVKKARNKLRVNKLPLHKACDQ